MVGENNDLNKLPFKIPKYKTYPLNTAINGILKAYGDDEVFILIHQIQMICITKLYSRGTTVQTI